MANLDDTTALKHKLKVQIIEYLNLLEITAEDIPNNEPLFGPAFGLDSIDSVELIVLLEREYGLKITDPKQGRKVLVDVDTIADYIITNTKTEG